MTVEGCRADQLPSARRNCLENEMPRDLGGALHFLRLPGRQMLLHQKATPWVDDYQGSPRLGGNRTIKKEQLKGKRTGKSSQ